MRRRGGWRRLARWLALPAAGLALLAGFGLGFQRFLEAAAAAPEQPMAPTEAIIVLTGGAARLAAGLALLDQGAAPLLLVTGAAPGITLAELARLEGRDPAALAGRVVLGHAAATTMGNAAEVAAFARARGLRSLRVVSAGYHMPRALLELGRALPEAALVAHPVVPPAMQGAAGDRSAETWTLLLVEHLKYLAALAGVSALVPAREAAR
jgi:uncharacterized SAM-binding protein YcdF (DUF218 family)